MATPFDGAHLVDTAVDEPGGVAHAHLDLDRLEQTMSAWPTAPEARPCDGVRGSHGASLYEVRLGGWGALLASSYKL